jgi:hydrogenase maturation protein HypF
MVAAGNEEAVLRLRRLKHREEKPFALMFPSLEQVRAACEVSELEARLLRSPEAPIVLLRRHQASDLAPSVAPGNPSLGAMLPYTPLHHLLLTELGFPVVATSGNLSDEPICTDEREALERLHGIADLFLVHNRPIVRHVDDSIVRVVLGRELVIRRARGYAPLPIHLHSRQQEEAHAVRSGIRHPESTSLTILAVGAHLKNAVALSVGSQAFVSQHIGDLETAEAFATFQRVMADFQELFAARPSIIVADLHPDYLATRFARESGLPLVSVQHHYAHVLACMAENELEPPVLGVAWDGTGYGLDGTVWGGEFLRVTEADFRRVAYLRPFPLPGGDKAVKEPRRSALGLLHEAFGDGVFDWTRLPPLLACSDAERTTLRQMLTRRINCPLTSSAGRLFDAVASLAGLRQRTRFEGQAAMELEFAAPPHDTADAYPSDLVTREGAAAQGGLIVDWMPMLRAILDDHAANIPVAEIAARFHNALAEMIVAVAKRTGERRVVLSGGCFQNQRLTERTVCRLQEEGLRPYWHQRIPPNDGGIALGQIVEAWRVSGRRALDGTRRS